MAYLYKSIAVAGTFDRLHTAHKQLLDKAISEAEQILCGITVPEMNRHKLLNQIILPFSQRETAVKQYFSQTGSGSRVTIIPISDRFGTADTRSTLSAIITTAQNNKQVDIINRRRITNNLPILKKIIVPLVNAGDGQPLSSSRIRLGQIDRLGNVYSQIFSKNNLILPDNERRYFRRPIGTLFKAPLHLSEPFMKNLDNIIHRTYTPMVITVGDIITNAFIQLKLPFSLCVVDNRSRRINLPPAFNAGLNSAGINQDHGKNNAGTISSDVVRILEKNIASVLNNNKKSVIKIEGEEDLLALPLVLLAPLESVILYGQPDRGVVLTRVTEIKKSEVKTLLNKFKQQ